MSAGDRPGLPLAAEPIGFLHPGLVGTVPPAPKDPAPRTPALAEEPALWLDLSGRPQPRPRPPVALPATGTRFGLAGAAVLAGAGWLLRRRLRPPGGD